MFFNQGLLILTYHRVLMVPDPLRPGQTDVLMFERHAATLAANFNVLDLEDAVSRIEHDSLPNRAVIITFDDGYSDNATTALPILKKNNLTATFFVATGFIDGGRLWNDTVIEAIRACPREELDLRSLDLGRWCLKTTADQEGAIQKILERVPEKSGPSRGERSRKKIQIQSGSFTFPLGL